MNFPGAHPSSEGKRRRNRSNVEAMTAKHSQQDNESAGETISNNKEDLNHNGRNFFFYCYFICFFFLLFTVKMSVGLFEFVF